eukprot:scaffold43996_cov66-Phaeocystis_antarctica.AAC.2
MAREGTLESTELSLSPCVQSVLNDPWLCKALHSPGHSLAHTPTHFSPRAVRISEHLPHSPQPAEHSRALTNPARPRGAEQPVNSPGPQPGPPPAPRAQF